MVGYVRTGFIWMRTGKHDSLWEDGNDISVFITGENFIRTQATATLSKKIRNMFF